MAAVGSETVSGIIISGGFFHDTHLNLNASIYLGPKLLPGGKVPPPSPPTFPLFAIIVHI